MYYLDSRTIWTQCLSLKTSEMTFQLCIPLSPRLDEEVLLSVDELDGHAETVPNPECAWALFSIKRINLNDIKRKKNSFWPWFGSGFL